MTEPLGAQALETLRAAVDTIVPADDWPGGWDGGVAALLDREGDAVLAWARPLLERATERLDAAARERGTRAFAGLDSADRTAALAELATGDAEALGSLLRVAYEGYYGSFRGFQPRAWGMIGFRPLGRATGSVEPDPVPTVEPGAAREAYDVVVVGAGAGGGVAAAVLAESGASVLLVERARRHTNAELRGDHLHGKRMALYDPTAGPGRGHPRVLADRDGGERVVDCITDPSAWGLNAMAVGGGTRVWQGMSWRFMPEDFEMATRYGVPEGSTLADWPIGYDDLAPYYDKVEWEIGVSGQSDGPLVERMPRARPYPMPPLPSDRCREAFGAAADRLGWGWGPVPFAINSIPHAGREACVRCPQCVGHASPVDAKNGTHNTVIPRAVATGRCDLLVGAQVVAIEHAGGSARAVRLVAQTTAGPVACTVRCERLVVGAGAVETPRLLMVSGLGSPAVGANLHNHSFTLFYGNAPEPLNPFAGPGHSIATLDFVHRDGEAWGGGVLFDAPPLLPLVAAQAARALGHPAWGAAHKRWMRTRLPYVAGAMGIGQDVPSAHARVTTDPRVTDAYGVPVARLVGDVHPATIEVRDYMTQRVITWLSEVGIDGPVDFFAGRPFAPAGEHSAGTCRMGEDPATSACDRDGRLHGSDNVYVADASLLPTNGSVNPCATTMANAWRTAEALAASA
jgi:choline dehydrogenase-like flavoprotein